MNTEREINLRELAYYSLKKWRIIVIIAVVVALISGLCKLTSEQSSELDAATTVSSDAIRNTLVQELTELQSNLNAQREYNDNSVIMKINPLNEYVGSFKIYVDSNYRINPSSSYQNADITNQLVLAYSSYLTSSEFYNYVFESTTNNADLNDEARYLAELIHVSGDASASMVSVTCIGDSKERVQEFVDVVKQAVDDKYPEIRNVIGDHECSIILESLYSTVDRDLGENQKANLQIVADCENAVAAKQAEIDNLDESLKSNASSLSTVQIVVKVIKEMIIGGILGAVLAMVVCLIMGVLSRKMWSRSAWQSFSIPVIAEIFTEKEHRKFEKFDNWLAKVMGFAAPKTSFEESAALTAAYISAMLREKGTSSSAIVVEAEKELCDKTITAMNKAESNAFVVVGDILTDPNAVSELKEVKDVVLLAEGEKITIDEVRKIAALLDVWGKKIHGVILVK